MQSKNTHFTAYSLHYKRMRNKRPAEDIWLPQIRRDFYKPWMDKFKRDDPILDVGCGWGHQIFILHHLGFTNIRGIEIVEDSLRIALEEVGEMGSIELADAFDFLADASMKFSVIVLNDVLEHIPRHRTEELLRLVYRALRPGGVISVRVPNMSSILASFSMHLDFTHFVGYTEFSLMQVLDSAGFVDHKVVMSRPKLFLSLVAPLRSMKRFVRVLFYLTNKALHLSFFLIRAQQLFPKTFEYNLEMYSHKPDGENGR
jgi:2-polyprenyl-3-methyl-5-hydroxy-6-metoxy-1,4-benzoquinol methylase